MEVNGIQLCSSGEITFGENGKEGEKDREGP